MILSGAAGIVIGALKGMFGKIEEDKPEQKTVSEPPQAFQSVEHVASNHEEPLRSPHTTRERVHAAGVEPKASHSQGMNAQTSHEETASRPKETALTR